MVGAAELVAQARLICGERHVLTDPVALATYREDGLRRDPAPPLPLAVALPGDSAEVAALLEACTQTGVAYTARGAGTSTGGGALPVPGTLMIALTRMRRILAVALDDDEITVQPGVPVAAISRAVSPTHVFSVDSPGTAGGAAAEGTAAAQLLGVDLVSPDGTLASFSSRTPGYDVVGAFAGSRGSCGIAVALTLRVVPGA